MKYCKRKLVCMIAMLFCMVLHVNAQKSIKDIITFPEGIDIEVTNDESNPWIINEEGAIISNLDDFPSSAELIFTNNSYTDLYCTFEWKADNRGLSCHDEQYLFYDTEIFGRYNEKQILIKAGSYIVLENHGRGCGYIKNITFTYASDNEHYTDFGFEIYKNNDGVNTVTISSYVGYGGSLFIPATITQNGIEYKVTKIGRFAFWNHYDIWDVVISPGITEISDYAFQECKGLHSVTIPNTVTSIGNEAFAYCNALENINIPNSITSIGDGAFSCCSLISVELPNSVTSIEDNTFSGCSSLYSISIPSSVTSIGERAFDGCTSLKSLTIPASVTTIARRAFHDCSGLKSIVVDDDNKNYDSRNNCNAIIDSKTNTLIVGSNNSIIPSSVTNIEEYAFYNCSGLTSITIPSSVTSIVNDAFRGCSGLTSVNISSSVTSIGGGAFEYCSGLTSINIPNSVTSIGGGAFEYCSGLTSVNIPSSVTSIENNAFYGCSGLTSIKVDINNKKFDSRDNCNSLIDSETNTLIIGCKNSTIPSSVTSIGNDAFRSCSGLISLNIPSSVTSIGDCAFEGCSGLTFVNISGSVISIGLRAFQDCYELTSLNIPNSVTNIGNYTFYNCSNLSNITIFGNLSSLQDYTFANIKNLSSVTLKGTEVIPVSRDFHEGYSSKTNLANCTLYVPASLLEDYKSATGWKQFGTILPLPEEADYSLYAKDYTVRPGSKARISLMMNNDAPITSWQTEMTLPEGFTLDEGDDAIILSDDRTAGTNLSVAYNTLANGAIKILASSASNDVFTDNYGKVATITLNVSPDVAEGDYYIEFANTRIVEPSTEKHIADKALSRVNVFNYMTGDLNNDGEPDASDLVAIVNYIMEKPVDGCIESAADINNDGDINGIDYVAEINLILGITPSANTKARVARIASNGNVSSSAVFMEAGTYQNMNIKLNGTNGNYSLMQFDITLPKGVKLAEDGAYILGANSMNHDIAVEHIRKNSYRVMMYSSKKSSIREEQNGVLSLSLVADNDMEVGEYNVNISGKLLVDAEGNYIKPASSAVKLTVLAPTAVETITSADAKADIYSLDGTLIRKAGSTEGLKNGMYISGGKKIIIK